MTRQFANSTPRINVTVGNRTFAYINHDELRLHTDRKALLAMAQNILDRDDPRRLPTDEAVLFKALHASVREMHVRQAQGKSLCTSCTISLVNLFDDICDILVRQNIGLVHDMRSRSAFRGLDLADLQSEGQFTLFRSITNFNPWKGFRFSTYACRSIQNAFFYLATKRQREICKTEAAFGERFQQDTCAESIQEERDEFPYGISTQHVRRILQNNEANLSTAERLIINERLLFCGDKRPPTLGTVGELLSLSKERVRQLQLAAIEKLRKVLLPSEDQTSSPARRRSRVEGVAA